MTWVWVILSGVFFCVFLVAITVCITHIQRDRALSNLREFYTDQQTKDAYELSALRRTLDYLDPTGEYRKVYDEWRDATFSTGGVFISQYPPKREREPWREVI